MEEAPGEASEETPAPKRGLAGIVERVGVDPVQWTPED